MSLTNAITVAEFIIKLQQHPGDAMIILEDADTGWEVPIIHIDYDKKRHRIILSGLYAEMVGTDENSP